MASIIPPEFQQFVDQVIGSGRYQSADDVVSDGLRLLQERERRLQELRAEIQPALEELNRGDFIDVEQQDLRAFFGDLVAEADAEMAREARRE
jgi:antitoxin ParD1/3/4